MSPTGDELLALVEVMERLRAECPWTRAQTHTSLRRYVIEEAYETAEAIDTGDDDHLREELGDLLMQVVIHSAVASTTTGWNIDDVARGIRLKLIERNPHVFGEQTALTAEEVDARWQQIKAESKSRTSALEGIPADLPALLYADKVLHRTGLTEADSDELGDELGDELLRLVMRARTEGIDPERALRGASQRLARNRESRR